jgi:hypothetical protein
MLPLRRVLGGEGRVSPFWVHIFIRGSTMETPTNNHQLFTITKIKRLARTGLLACSGACISLGLLTPAADAQDAPLVCGQSVNVKTKIEGSSVSYAAHAIDDAKEGAENLFLEQLVLDAVKKSEAIAKARCPKRCPGTIDDNSLDVDPILDTPVISGFFGDNMKKAFLEECENVTAVEAEKKGDDRKRLCEKTYSPGRLYDNTAFVAYQSGKGELTFGLTCPRETIRVEDVDVEKSPTVRIGREIR